MKCGKPVLSRTVYKYKAALTNTVQLHTNSASLTILLMGPLRLVVADKLGNAVPLVSGDVCLLGASADPVELGAAAAGEGAGDGMVELLTDPPVAELGVEL